MYPINWTWRSSATHHWKSYHFTIKPHIIQSAGDVQLCAGQQARCEAAVHADEETDALHLCR